MDNTEAQINAIAKATTEAEFNSLSEAEQLDVINGTITAVCLNMLNWQVKMDLKRVTGATCLSMLQLLTELGFKVDLVIGICLCFKGADITGIIPHCWCETPTHVVDPSMDLRRSDIETGTTARRYYNTLAALFKGVPAIPEEKRMGIIDAVLNIEQNIQTLLSLGPESDHMKPMLDMYRTDSFTDPEQVHAFTSTLRAAAMNPKGCDILTGVDEPETEPETEAAPLEQVEATAPPRIFYAE